MQLLIHTRTNLEFNWLKVLSPFWMEDVDIFLGYLKLFLDTVFPISQPNLKSVALTTVFLGQSSDSGNQLSDSGNQLSDWVNQLSDSSNQQL